MGRARCPLPVIHRLWRAGACGSKHAQAARDAGDARVETVATAVQAPDVIVLAVPWDAAPAAIVACGDLTGRVPVDLTKPLHFGSDGLELALGCSTSGAEQIAEMPRSRDGQFVTGDDANAKAGAWPCPRSRIRRARRRPLKMARLLEPCAMLWINQVMVPGAPGDNAFAFRSRRA
jgi:predicted dinucleotide-binding enzyme